MWIGFLILSSKCWVKVHLAPGVKGVKGVKGFFKVKTNINWVVALAGFQWIGKLVVVWFRAGHLVGNYIVFVAIHWFCALIFALVNVLIKYQPPQASTMR